MGKLFLSGTARGGTNLAIMMLSANKHINLCQDPLLPLLKYYKATILNENIIESMSNPLDEYYYYDNKIKNMFKIQDSNMKVPLDSKYLKDLNIQLKNRMSLSSPQYVNKVDKINEKTFSNYIEKFINIISTKDILWSGFNDNWAIEFFKPMHNTFKDSKFISIVRDGRDALSSHIKLVDARHINPLYKYKKTNAMLAMSLSFIRCWRKQIAFTYHYKKILKEKFFVIKYEDLVKNPIETMQKACSFLDIKYNDDMVNSKKLISGDGNIWLSNSNHSNSEKREIYSTSIGKWKTTLPNSLTEMFNFCANPELIMAGYEDKFLYGKNYVPHNSIKRHIEEVKNWMGGSFGWRTDNNDPELDFKFEIKRNTLSQIVEKNLTSKYDKNTIQKFYLFEDNYFDLKSKKLSPL